MIYWIIGDVYNGSDEIISPAEFHNLPHHKSGSVYDQEICGT